ncbi:EpsG family protein [Klebsiella aerogenes]|uniref:EpsG family protein n=1 Tax=Klebsiella aerogenes TaxID=548 RepID=UPI002DB621C3|nr:EpsG family protein [Klebsiella aerogenes]MEB5696073.1 EpsG family protein [Klebsiella aerogenes]
MTTHKSDYDEFNWAKATISIILLLSLSIGICISPHIAFWMAIALLLTKYSNVKIIRNLLVIIAVVMIIFTVTSREIGISVSDDLTKIYMPIVESQKEGFGIFGTWMGLEIGYGAYMSMFLNFVPNPNARLVLLFSVILSTLLYLVWILYFLLPKIPAKNRGLILAISLSFLQIGFLSQFLRQEIATPLILMAIFLWEDNKKKQSLLVLFISIIFHTSSLFIFLFYLMFSRLRKLYILVGAVTFLVMVLILNFRPTLLISLFDALHLSFFGGKLVYYISASKNSIIDAVKNGKFFFIILMLILVRWRKIKENSLNMDNNDWLFKIVKFSFWGCIYTVPLLLLPNASRFFLVVPGFLFPLCIYAAFKREIGFIHVLFVFFVLFSLLVPGRLNGGINDGFDIWKYYPWYSDQLFYYISWVNDYAP